MTLVLASQSAARRAMLAAAHVPFTTTHVAFDEDALTEAMIAQGAKPRDIADALAEGKARKAALKHDDTMVLGCDQVLALANGELINKAENREQAKYSLQRLSGQKHILLSAAVIYENGEPVWRAVEEVKMLMRPLSDGFIDDYLDRHWDDVRYCVGCYRIEEEGMQLFNRIEGSHFAIMGMPLLPLLGYLRIKGIMPS